MKIVIKCIEHDDYGKEIEEVNNEIELSSIRFEENEEYIEPDDERFPISTHDYIDKFIGDAQTKKDAVVDPDDVETLQDMTVQALNDALGQIDEATKKSMGAFAGKLPF